MSTRMLGVYGIITIILSTLWLTEANNIYWEEPTKEVKQGETFSLKCIIKDLRRIDVVRLVKENEGEDNQISISDRAVVKSPFVETNRYTVSFSTKEKTVTLSFTGEGVRGEDGGRIGCHKLEDNPEIAWVDLKVLVPVKEVYIAEIDDTAHETRVNLKTDMVNLEEGKERGALCKATVSGSLTPPTLRILVDGEDKTAMFIAAPKSESQPNGGLPAYSSEMQLTYNSRNPDPSFNGKSFVCEAEMEGFEKSTAEAIFSVEFGPIVKCSKYEYYAVIGSPMTFGCDVQSNPPATVQWNWGNSHEIKSGQADEANHMAAEERGLETVDKKQVSLEISQITEDHLGTYTLSASNDYGNKSVTLELRKASAEPKVKPNPNAGEQNEQHGSENPEKVPQSVTGAGVGVGYNLWNLLLSLPLSIFIFITVT